MKSPCQLRMIPIFLILTGLSSCIPKLEINDFDSSTAIRLDPTVSNYTLEKNQLIVYTGHYTVDGRIYSEISSSDSTVTELVLTDRIAPVNGDNEGITDFYFKTKKRGTCIITAKEFNNQKQTTEFIFHVQVR